MDYKNKKIAVLGYGLEGKDVVDFLLKNGAKITVFDKQKIAESEKNINFVVGEDYLKQGLNDYDIIVRSPGVYRFIPEIVEAEKSGVVLTSPIKMFFDECKSKIIGVTGTKGKGTTVTLIKNILENGGKEAYLVGNIGKPYLEILDRLNNESIVVMEMSSFQLFDLHKSPNISVVLNITSDHLDWHKDQSEYVDAKKSIVMYQTKDDFAVINEEYEIPKSFAKLTKAKVILFSKTNLDDKYKKNLLLRGQHNLENIAAAVSVAKILDINDDVIIKTLSTFKGLEHRLELVDTVNGVTFYNDSFATGPHPTIAAVKSFEEQETLILGGSDKGLDYQELGREISNTKNVKNIILIGQVRDSLKGSLSESKYEGNVFDLGTSKMSDIVKKSLEVTPTGGVVILSPAAASFDMFENYKDRGNQFKESVNKLK